MFTLPELEFLLILGLDHQLLLGDQVAQHHDIPGRLVAPLHAVPLHVVLHLQPGQDVARLEDVLHDVVLLEARVKHWRSEIPMICYDWRPYRERIYQGWDYDIVDVS